MEKPLEVNFVSELDCDSICKVLTFVCSAHISSMNGARGCTFAHENCEIGVSPAEIARKFINRNNVRPVEMNVEKLFLFSMRF